MSKNYYTITVMKKIDNNIYLMNIKGGKLKKYRINDLCKTEIKINMVQDIKNKIAIQKENYDITLNDDINYKINNLLVDNTNEFERFCSNLKFFFLKKNITYKDIEKVTQLNSTSSSKPLSLPLPPKPKPKLTLQIEKPIVNNTFTATINAENMESNNIEIEKKNFKFIIDGTESNNNFSLNPTHIDLSKSKTSGNITITYDCNSEEGKGKKKITIELEERDNYEIVNPSSQTLTINCPDTTSSNGNGPKSTSSNCETKYDTRNIHNIKEIQEYEENCDEEYKAYIKAIIDKIKDCLDKLEAKIKIDDLNTKIENIKTLLKNCESLKDESKKIIKTEQETKLKEIEVVINKIINIEVYKKILELLQYLQELNDDNELEKYKNFKIKLTDMINGEDTLTLQNLLNCDNSIQKIKTLNEIEGDLTKIEEELLKLNCSSVKPPDSNTNPNNLPIANPKQAEINEQKQAVAAVESAETLPEVEVRTCRATIGVALGCIARNFGGLSCKYKNCKEKVETKKKKQERKTENDKIIKALEEKEQQKAKEEEIQKMLPTKGGAIDFLPEIIEESNLLNLLSDFKVKNPELYEKSVKEINKITKIKNAFNKMRNEFTNKNYNFDNEEIEYNNLKSNVEAKFNIYAHYFQKRDLITRDFVKYLIKCIFIPHKSHEYYIKKRHITKKLQKLKERLDKKYDFTELSKKEEDKELLNFIEKFKPMEKEVEIYQKLITGENLTKKSIDDIIDEHNLMKEKMLKYKNDNLDNEKIKKYFFDRLKYDKAIKMLDELSLDYFLIRKETQIFSDNLQIKKNKFYELNLLFLQVLSYIENEINIGLMFKLKIPVKIKNQYIKICKEIYIHFFTLKLKISDLNRKIKKRKVVSNKEFKRILLDEEVLKKQIKTAFYRKDKEELIEKYKDLQKELYFFKYNFFNLKLCISFNQNITRKSNISLCNVDHTIQYVRNNYLWNYLRNLNDNKFTQKRLEKNLIKIKKNLKALVASKTRLFLVRKKMVKRYNKTINLSLKKSEEIAFDGIVPSREKKILQDAENLKLIKVLEEKKIKLEEEIHYLIDINKKYLVMRKPIMILYEREFINKKNVIIKKTIKIKRKKEGKNKEGKISKKQLKFKGIKFILNSDKLKEMNISENKKYEKLITSINKQYNKEQRFNLYNTLKKFVTA